MTYEPIRHHAPQLISQHTPTRFSITVSPQITNSNQQSESILALVVGILVGVAGALAAMEQAKRGSLGKPFRPRRFR